MLRVIKRVEYIDGYKLQLLFDDGKVKLIDFADRLKLAKNMFLPLLNVEYFKKVKTDGTTIVWPNGLDLCPDTLYSQGVEIKHQKRAASKRKISRGYVRPRKKTSAKSK